MFWFSGFTINKMPKPLTNQMITTKNMKAIERDRNVPKIQGITTRNRMVQMMLNEGMTHHGFKVRWDGGPAPNKTPVGEALQPDMWKGRRCFIIGGGPSLENHRLERLRE